MAKPQFTRLTVQWGAYRLMKPRARSGTSRQLTTVGVYGQMLKGTADRIKLRKQQLRPARAIIMRSLASRKTTRGKRSAEPLINPNTGRKLPDPYPYLWVPKPQTHFSKWVRTVGTRDYANLLEAKLSPRDARWSRIGVPRQLSVARHVMNLCRFSETGAFRAFGKTFILARATRTAFASKAQSVKIGAAAPVNDNADTAKPVNEI
ncbi:hypothetical protein L3556_06370 [Candidatus Synechococcus calcipolaris G9]|uniref:Uncharacterized protein n=1 Tax=Candidatus Synechococcus calcipolaris G9 TaxID=1497997 RepID=A0ABT6EZ39_9SYNE|nr:hypothetical protein [Candidatus Synechococcus calcipolaris]MDG2990560.1 hypothetical protein [Candidatus Synechococcus calcipolaris G9]